MEVLFGEVICISELEPTIDVSGPCEWEAVICEFFILASVAITDQEFPSRYKVTRLMKLSLTRHAQVLRNFVERRLRHTLRAKVG